MKKFIFTKNQVYKPHCYLYQYNDDYFRVVLIKNQREKGFEARSSGYSLDSDIEKASLSRTKRNIRELALCNNFTHFATLTISSDICDRYNLELCQDKLKKILHHIKRVNNSFKFLFITEKHKDGAFHFHGLITSIPFYTNSNGYLSSVFFDKLGFNSFSPIRDYSKTCNYILKYITKDCIRNSHNQIYISSRGLKKADRYEIPLIDLNWSYENDFVKLKDFSSSELSKAEIFKFFGFNNQKNLKNF